MCVTCAKCMDGVAIERSYYFIYFFKPEVIDIAN